MKPCEGNYLSIDKTQCEEILKGFKLRNVDSISKFALASAKMALENRRISIEKDKAYNYGLVLGTEYGVLNSIHDFDMVSVEKGALSVNPGLFPNTVLNSPACQVGIQLGIAGPIFTVSNGVCSGLDAISIAYHQIKSEMATMVMAGGADEVCQLQLAMHESVLPIVESSAFVILEDSTKTSFEHKNKAIEIVAYDSNVLYEWEEKNIIESCIELINNVINQSDLYIEDIGLIDCSILTDKKNGEKLVNNICNQINFSGNLKFNNTDKMGATGIVQLVQLIKNIEDEQLKGKRTATLILNIGNERISLLLVNKYTDK